MSILIGADLVPTDTNKELFMKGDASTLVGEDLLSVLLSADYRIFNLEVPLTNTWSPIDKCGPNLIAPTECIYGYKALNVDLLTIANNHILDQGDKGVISTIKILEENKINYIGGGKNLREAAKPYTIKFNQQTIGIYACAEHEFASATDKSAGANPFDALESFDHVAALKRQCDFIVVLYHGGKEHYRYPSPDLQRVCRKFIDKGADLIICQHSHCIGCEEKYNGGTIVYGQGNFLFDHSNSDFWMTSLLIRIEDDFKITYIPIMKKENSVQLADHTQSEKILSEYKSRSKQIKVGGFIEENYEEFSREQMLQYLSVLSGKHCFFYRALNKLCGHRLDKFFLKRKYGKKQLLVIRNFIECEAHRELLLKGLSKIK